MPSALLLASSRTMATLRVRILRNHAAWECIFRIRDRNSADGIRTTSRPTGKTKPYSGPTTQIREGKSRLADLLQGIVTGRSGRLTGVQEARIDSITELAPHADDRKEGPRSNRRSPAPKKYAIGRAYPIQPALAMAPIEWFPEVIFVDLSAP
jgi:hypothetical protein